MELTLKWLDMSGHEGPSRLAFAEHPVEIDRTLSFKRLATAKACAHWLALKGTRAMPSRSDVAPAALRDVLPKIALVDVPTGGASDYVIRLAGDAIQRVYGAISGRPLKDVMPAETTRRWSATFDEVIRMAVPLRFAGRVAFEGKSWLQYEAFLAPLGEGDRIVMLFGAIETWAAAQP